MLKSDSQTPCVFCTELGGELVFQNDQFRVVWASEPLYPGFLRLIWNAHVREFTHLTEAEQAHCMRVVSKLEVFVLDVLGADKCNLASLGNVTPHLHWHVIPRFVDDPHFPAPVWCEAPANATLSPKQIAISDNKQKFVSLLGDHLAKIG